MTLNEKLKQAKKEWSIKSDYDRQSLEEVLNYNKQFRLENKEKYPYNDRIKEYILENETIDQDLIDQLGTEIYLSQHDIDNEKKEVYKIKMLEDGWLELNEEAVKETYKNNQRIIVKANIEMDLFSTSINQEYKPFVKDNGDCFLMKPKARSRGYYLHTFKNAFYKVK